MRQIDADALLENYNLKDATKYGNKNAEQQHNSYNTMMMYEIADMIENAPTINEWIPCSKRLPSREEYQKCNGLFIVSDGNRTYSTYFDIYDSLRFGEPTIERFRIDKCVIAWMSLPEPYKGE